MGLACSACWFVLIIHPKTLTLQNDLSKVTIFYWLSLDPLINTISYTNSIQLTTSSPILLVHLFITRINKYRSRQSLGINPQLREILYISSHTFEHWYKFFSSQVPIKWHFLILYHMFSLDQWISSFYPYKFHKNITYTVEFGKCEFELVLYHPYFISKLTCYRPFLKFQRTTQRFNPMKVRTTLKISFVLIYWTQVPILHSFDMFSILNRTFKSLVSH